MSNDYRPSNVDPLAQHIDSARAVPDAVVDAAQARLQQRLHTRGLGRAVRMRWLPLAGATALALAFLLITPMLPLHRDAFAAVRAHFANFNTLTMQIEQHFGGQPLQTTQMRLRADGSLRSDVGDQVSVIIDIPQHRMLTLLHGPREALSMELPAQPGSTDDALNWLQEIRQFQGEAEQMQQTRNIAGIEASGWKLALRSTSLTLWATDDGLPLAMAMEQSGEGGLRMDIRFEFDLPLADEVTSSNVPAGYTVVEADAD